MQEESAKTKRYELTESIEKAQEYLLSAQKEEGYWQGYLPTNPSMEAEYIMLTQFLNLEQSDKWEKIANYLKNQQREEGFWTNYEGGPGDLSTTIECYFALKLAGESPNLPHMRKARNFIMKQGGIPESRVFTKIWLSLFEIWEWSKIPEMPPELIFFPRWFPIDIYDFASWARQTVVPLLVVISQKPVRPVPEEKTVPELFPQNWKKGYDFGNYSFFSWENFFIQIDKCLRVYGKLPWKPGRERAEKRCINWIIERQEKDGSWGGIQPPWVYSLIALEIMGYSRDHPVMKKGIEGLEDYAVETEEEWWLQASVSPIWDTAWGIISSLESGLSTDHPAIRKAGKWLLGKEVREKGDWAVNNNDLEPGGWAFEFENENYPDIDDTAEVVIALKKADLEDKRKLKAIDRGVNWLLGLQSSNGGWGAYDVDNDKDILYKIPFADFGAMIDPPSVDVTSHVIEMLGELGFSKDHSLVKKPLQYVKKEQKEDGSWFGRWGVNYVYGVGTVLPALEAIDEDMNKQYIKKAVRWTIEHQNDDGGWGETPESYEDPSLAGKGPSTPSQTAWALLGLIAADELNNPATKKGIDYLVSNQTNDGTWKEEKHTGTGFPGDFYLIYRLYCHYFPLLALGRYKKRIDNGAESPN